MPSNRLWGFLTLAAAAALAACSSSGSLSRYTHDSPEAARQAARQPAVAAEPAEQPTAPDPVYLDGTGPGAQTADQAEPRQIARRPVSAAARPARAERPAAEPLKPYSDEWWDKEKREDARLRQKMNICRGC